MRKYIIALALCCCSLTSCIKDEAPNKECDIESAWIEGEEYQQYFYQTNEMRKESIGSIDTKMTCVACSLVSVLVPTGRCTSA